MKCNEIIDSITFYIVHKIFMYMRYCVKYVYFAYVSVFIHKFTFILFLV